MQSFPQELLHYIVEFVQDDRQTLATIRLVGHSWNISARTHLFRSLDLLISDIPGSKAMTHGSGGSSHVPKVKYTGIEKFQSLLSLLETGADISHCVREVSLGRTARFNSTDPESHKQQNIYSVLISSILGRFKHLSDIVFREMNWANLAPSFLSCILEICKTPTLERIEIWNCQMPTASSLLDFLGASRNVKSLRLSYFRILTADIDIEETKLSPTTTRGDRDIEHPSYTEPCTSLLHSLAIDATPDTFILNNVIGIRPYSINFLQLRRLYLGNVSNTVGVAEFLRKAGQSLEFLDMRILPCTLYVSQSGQIVLIKFFFSGKQIQSRLSAVHLDLSHCPRLQNLRLSGLHWTPSICPSEYLSSLFAKTSLPIECLQLVVTVLKPKSMTPVVVNCRDESQPVNSARPTELHYSDWNILDTVLSSHIFHVLQTFQISMKTIREGDVDPSKLSNMFPKLKDKGVQVTCL